VKNLLDGKLASCVTVQGPWEKEKIARGGKVKISKAKEGNATAVRMFLKNRENGNTEGHVPCRNTVKSGQQWGLKRWGGCNPLGIPSKICDKSHERNSQHLQRLGHNLTIIRDTAGLLREGVGKGYVKVVRPEFTKLVGK